FRATRRAVRDAEVLAAMRTEIDVAVLGKIASAIRAPVGLYFDVEQALPLRSRRFAAGRRAIRPASLESRLLERDGSVREFTNACDIGVWPGQLALQSITHALVDVEIAFGAAEQPHQRQLVVMIGFQAELAAKMTIRKNPLIQVGDRER